MPNAETEMVEHGIEKMGGAASSTALSTVSPTPKDRQPLLIPAGET